MTGTVQSALHLITHKIITITLWAGCHYHHSHFTEEETRARWLNCPSLYSTNAQWAVNIPVQGPQYIFFHQLQRIYSLICFSVLLLPGILGLEHRILARPLNISILGKRYISLANVINYVFYLARCIITQADLKLSDSQLLVQCSELYEITCFPNKKPVKCCFLFGSE